MKNSLVRDQIRQQGQGSEQETEKPKPLQRSAPTLGKLLNEENENSHTSHKALNQRTAFSPAPTKEQEARKIAEDEQYMLDEETRMALKKVQRGKLLAGVRKGVQALLIIGSVYLVFLIYGVMNTEFTYDARGRSVPRIVSIDNIRENNDFTTMKTQYVQARALYERVLTFDYRLAMGAEDPLLIAPEYEKLLDDVSSLSVQVGAITPSAKYTQPMSMLLSWIQNDLALYCQYMSRAITQNNISDANKATSYKDIMYNNFMQITQVIATLGSDVEGADISDIVTWTPENYIFQAMGGM